MNNNAMMMLLPLLMSKSMKGGSGFSPEMLSAMLGNKQENPMMALMLSMMTNKSRSEQKEKTDEPNLEELFGKDVAAVLLAMRNKEDQSV